MDVLKFGGAPLRSASGFGQMIDILKVANPGLVVVSALSTTTRDLQAIAESSQAGDLKGAKASLRGLIERHEKIAADAILDPTEAQTVRNALLESEKELLRLIGSVAFVRQLTAKTLDRVLSFGEKFSLDIAYHSMRSAGLDVIDLDAQKIIVTTANFGSAVPIEAKTKVHVERELAPLLAGAKFVVTQGFVGATEAGESTTMGRESSNMTATLLGSLIGVDRVVIYTDVAGVRSADPRICSDTEPRPGLTYACARQAANHGLKLLYPTMIEPAERANIPVQIASVRSPSGDFTQISSAAAKCDPIVTLREGDDAETMRVSVVFGSVSEWLQAVSSAISVVKDLDDLYVNSNPADEAVTIACSKRDAPELAKKLHEILVTSKKGKQNETSP